MKIIGKITPKKFKTAFLLYFSKYTDNNSGHGKNITQHNSFQTTYDQHSATQWLGITSAIHIKPTV